MSVFRAPPARSHQLLLQIHVRKKRTRHLAIQERSSHVIIVTKNFVWWNPAHYTDHELWVATFTEADDQTARSRWPQAFQSVAFNYILVQSLLRRTNGRLLIRDRELKLGYISSDCGCYDYEFAP